MKYRNKRTGVVIDVESELGGDWEPVKAPTAQKTEKAAPVKKRGTTKK